MILAADPDEPRRRSPLPITICERCHATEAACEAARLFAGRSGCCDSCDHGGDRETA